MALTAEVIQNLEGKSFNTLYDSHGDKWRGMVASAITYVQATAPAGLILPADVATIVATSVARDTHFRGHCQTRKIHGRHWAIEFAEYVVDRGHPNRLPPGGNQ
jgi:hypothetical protein